MNQDINKPLMNSFKCFIELLHRKNVVGSVVIKELETTWWKEIKNYARQSEDY